MITPEMYDAVDKLNRRFNYGTEGSQHVIRDLWKVMPLGKVLEGGYDDYSLNVLKYFGGESRLGMLQLLLDGTAAFHYVRVPQADGRMTGHCVLEYKGKYVDNIFRKWVSKEYMEGHGKYQFVFKLRIPLIVINYLKAKVVLGLKWLIKRVQKV